MDTVCVKAYGKVNLGLDVIGKRPDGYHLVRMVMQTVDVCDDVTITISDEPEGVTQSESFFVSVSCDVPEVPTDESNLAYRAAILLADRYHLQGSVGIAIAKRIPMAAGMAGGSADGAAVIEGLNRLYDLRMTPAQKDEIALRLGADVPFCLRRGTYLAEGIGEKLTPLPDAPRWNVLIGKPPIDVSTGFVYQLL